MRRIAAGLAVLIGTGALVGLPATGAAAAPRVVVTNERGTATADLTYSTPITVKGSGFQSIKGGFGGIYVLFGWVDDPRGGSWAPSRGGQSGVDYAYVPDSETKDNQGYQRFVAFPGSDTEYAANGGEIAADGSWSLTMTIPGPTFEAEGRSGEPVRVDCRTRTCGIITIGAHGVTNANNESFTPVTFGHVLDSAAAGAAPAATPASGAATPAAASAEGARVGLGESTIVVGRVLAFTGQGFTPGEQVVGTLGAGLAAVGPLTAGAQGEVAGAIQLPADLRPGTQTLRLTGAASGAVAEAELTAIADPAVAAAAANATAVRRTGTSPVVAAVGVAALLVLAFLVASFATARRRRRAARGARAADARRLAAAEGTEPSPDAAPGDVETVAR